MSNTSGSQIANIGFLQRGLLEKFSAFLGVLASNLTKVLNGEAVLALVDVTSKAGSDKIADSIMEEIARRLVVTMEAKTNGNVVFQALAPSDHSKVWSQIDPVTGIPIGYPKVWNSDTASWVAVAPVESTYVPPKTRHGTLFADQGQSQSTFKFDSIGTTDYSVIITPTTYISGSWAPAPGTFPTHFGWEVTNKGEAEVTLNFFGTPEDGINFEIDITERI